MSKRRPVFAHFANAVDCLSPKISTHTDLAHYHGLSREAIETALKVEVFHILPNDYEGVQKAVLDGKMVQPGSKFGKAILGLCERLTGLERAPKKTWSSFLPLPFRGQARRA